MEEIEELRAKAIASMAAASAASLKKSPHNKEEGELSTSDEGEIPAGSATVPPKSTVVALSKVESSVASVRKSNQASKTGKIASRNDLASSADPRLRTSVKPNYSKPVLRKPSSSTLGNPYTSSWHAPSVPDNNLVICFSDDDSGSDSQKQRPKEFSEIKEAVSRAERPSSQAELEYTSKNVKSQMKRKSRIDSTSRTSVSSLTKIHGAIPRASGSSLAEQISHVRSPDLLLNKGSSSQQNEISPGMNLNNSKLEDLRQKIARRENQLKVKPVQQTKEIRLVSCHDHGGINLNGNAAKKSGPALDNTSRLLSDEPEKKRMKVEHYPRKSNSNLHELATQFSKSRMALLENIRQEDENLTTCSRFLPKNNVGTVDLVADARLAKVHKQVPVVTGNLVHRVNNPESSRPNNETTSSEVANNMFRNTLGGCSSDIRSNDYQYAGMNRLIHFSGGLNGNPASVQTTSKEDVQQLESCSPKKSNTDGPNVHGAFGAVRSLSMDKEAQHTVVQSSAGNEIGPSERAAPVKNNMVNKGSVLVPEIKFRTSNESPSNITLQDNTGQKNLLGHNHKNLQTLLEMEELHDKELEEAQEHRCRCEVAEKDALRAYRESQRALFEANAKCSYLYRKRELFSAQFRTLMMEDPSSLWPSWQGHPKFATDSLNNNREADVDHLSALGHQSHAELETVNHDSSMQPTDGVIVHTSCQQTRDGNFFSEPCNEPKSSTLELLHHKDNDVNSVCTPSHHTNMSTDEDEEAALFGHKTAPSLVMREEAACSRDLNKNSERVCPVDSGNNYALLEAALRSELCARLGKRNVSKHNNLRDGEECTTNDGPGSLVVNTNSDQTMSNKRDAQSGEEHISNIGGTLERSTYSPIQVHGPTQVLGDKCSEDLTNRIDNTDENSSSLAKSCKSTGSVIYSPSPSLKLAFTYMKVTPPTSFGGIQMKTQKTCIYDTIEEDESGLAHSELLLGVLRARLRGNMGEVGCYACDFPLDPFWPVCMFELRGRCNDDECVWQHRRDYTEKNINQRDYSESVGTCSQQQCIVLAPPTYFVGLDIMKADFHTSGSVLAQSIGRCGQKGFSLSASLPYTIQKTFFPNVPSFDSDNGRIAGQGSRNRQSMYFQSQDVSLIRRDLDDPEQCLDMAVLFDGDVNRFEGMKKAQIMLSRALEAHPTFVALWIVYLHIHYMNETTIGEDDMFSLAIRYNEGSYELWLMYINSRVHLDDRLVSYDSALSALCQHASSPNRDRVHDSACILDLFLQLLDCLCMSGDKGKAIQRICALLPTTTGASNNSSVLLSDILACLTVSDKCIFWICCVYVVIYGKLPDAVVQQLEFEKRLEFVVEWPSVQSTAVEKHKALELMKMGVDSVALNGGMYEREVCFLSVSHVQSVAALEGIECSKSLLEHYVKTYPTCLELVLTSARLHRNYFGDLSFVGFENALSSWPKEAPGVQCIWNQYAQCALESGGFDFAKQLMVRWFESVWKVDCPQSGKLDVMEDDGLYHSPESVSPNDVSYTFSNPKDELFGLLNLSLYRLSQNDRTEAQFTIDKALKVASPEDFEHCVREHALFISTDILCQTEDALSTRIPSLLNVYLNDVRVRPVSDPLSRKFCRDIKKPRIRQLISNLFGPVPCNYSLVNSVLESWYGPSLLPENYGDLKELVDLVETLMEMYPANYPLALAVCKLIARKFTSSGTASATTLFWASSILVNSIYQALPVPPEHKLVDVVEILNTIVDVHGISERFHQYVLSLYPFSVRLWESYYKLSKKKGDESSVVQRARERGIQLE